MKLESESRPVTDFNHLPGWSLSFYGVACGNTLGYKFKDMKKVLLASDCKQFSEGAFEFARRLNEKEDIFLTGAFLPHFNYSGLWSYASGESGGLLLPSLEGDDAEAANQNIERFEMLCRKNNIDYRIHKNFFDFALPEFRIETRFADLVILSSEVFYGTYGTMESSEYLKDALHEAECPVLVVPEKFQFPKSNILAYDGSASSVFAIKQFSYLFPELCDNKTWLVTLSEHTENKLPHEENIEELAGRHFSYLNIIKLGMDQKENFANWIEVEKSDPIVVAGSYGRSFWSRLFKKSFISQIITRHKYPVFITHI